MDFDLPPAVMAKLAELDAFIAREIRPLEEANPQFFDHRREYARTDWENDGRPAKAWRDLLSEMERRADAAGHLRLCLPESCGGQAAGNLMNAAVREHLAARGLGLHNDLQDENSVVGNFPIVPAIARYGTEAQQVYVEGIITGTRHLSFALTEPDHGSDATWMETRAVRDGDHWVINGRKRWNSQVGRAEANLVFARTSGEDGKGRGITAFIVPTDTPGHRIVMNHWTFNMPSDHSEVELKDVRVPDSAILHKEGEGLKIALMFIHENRIRQAAGSVGATRYCIRKSVEYAKNRVIFGEPLAERQAIQFPLAELHAECEMVRTYIFRTAAKMDRQDPATFSDEISICNYMANNLVCRAADFAMQVHGGLGYSRHMPFEHIYRHHRRYKITEGSEEVQKRRIAKGLFAFGGAE
ncbi:MAG: acyl-CoA dehydrogenase family protein [Rhodobacteraceae bacterium]|nr:acyl-CoA dehydrogenase family protein [Paracoccaceae bacterium]